MQLTAWHQECCDQRVPPSKTHLSMKLFILIAVSFFTGFCASAQSININLRQVPPEKVLKEIQEQTLYRFVYTKEQLASLPDVSIRVKNASLDEVLRVCFAKQPIEWEVEGNVVVLKRKENAATGVEAHQFAGRVLNEFNEPMPSVSVTHLTSKQQTATDAEGYFNVNGRDGDELGFTYVGYEKVRILLVYR